MGDAQPFAGLKDVPASLIFWFQVGSKVLDLLSLSVKWGAIAFCAYQFSSATAVLAGKTTTANFLLALVQPEHEGEFGWVWPAVSGAFFIWAVIERVLRYRKVTYLAGRVAKLEKAIDPKRESSGLAASGRTHPRDR